MKIIKGENDLDRLEEIMNVFINKNKEYLKIMKNVKIACDNFEKAMAKYIAKNKYKILKELVEEHNKIMGGDCGTKGMTK